jgi:hypothetical protein
VVSNDSGDLREADVAAAARGDSDGTLVWACAFAVTAAGAFRYAPRLRLAAEVPPAAVLVAATVAAASRRTPAFLDWRLP